MRARGRFQIPRQTPVQGVFTEKGARFRGKWGSAPSVNPPPKKFPVHTPAPPLPSPGRTPPPWIFSKTSGIFSKTPTARQEKGGAGTRGRGGGGRGPMYRENEHLFRRKRQTPVERFPNFPPRREFQGQMNRGNRTEGLWEGNLPLRGSRRGSVFRGVQRL